MEAMSNAEIVTESDDWHGDRKLQIMEQINYPYDLA